MVKKRKRAAILAITAYAVINGLVWGLMKAYVSSYNALSREKLVMADISECSGGREITVMGNSFVIKTEKKDGRIAKAVLPVKVRAVSGIFAKISQKIVRDILK